MAPSRFLFSEIVLASELNSKPPDCLCGKVLPSYCPSA
jgi:hypothetical protein